MKIYIACALTHVPRNHFEEYVAFLHRLAAALGQGGEHDVNYALVNSDPQLATKPTEERARLCYLWDSRMVQEADVVIGECSFPSIGLGIELQIAAENETPIVLIFRDFNENRATPVTYHNPDHSDHDLQIGDGSISLMALGLPTVFKVHKYADSESGIERVCETVRVLER